MSALDRTKEEFYMMSKLKKLVCDANLLLPKYGLVTFTWATSSRSTGEGSRGHQAQRRRL
jgi:ribulose-5-phosphate 4-epimerase/fuculose-1-phosphate aldolase